MARGPCDRPEDGEHRHNASAAAPGPRHPAEFGHQPAVTRQPCRGLVSGAFGQVAAGYGVAAPGIGAPDWAINR